MLETLFMCGMRPSEILILTYEIVNEYFQNMKCSELCSSPDEFNIFGLYVAHEAGKEWCKLGIMCSAI